MSAELAALTQSPPDAEDIPVELTGLIPPAIPFVTFTAPASTSITPTPRSTTWDQLARRLTRHERRPDKDGPGWSPAVYKRDKAGRPLTRSKPAVEAVTMATADLDHVEFDDVVQVREHVREMGLAGALYSTHSSTELAPRVRVVVPFTEPVPAELWPRLWPALTERLFLGLSDRAASDASRMYYLPAAPDDVAVLAERWAGAALDWRALPLADPATIVEAAPVATSGAGPAETVAAADLAVLEQLFSDRHGAKRMRAWSGDCSDFGGDASAADMSLANGLVFYCRGDVARAERIMRAGPWRPRWDELRGATTLLGYTLSKALASYRARVPRPGAPVPRDEAPAPDEAPPPDETPEQRAARFERLYAEERRGRANDRAAHAVLQTAHRAVTAELADKTAFLSHFSEVLAKPNEELSAGEKVVSLALLIEIHFRADYGPYTLPDGTEGSYRTQSGKIRMPRDVIAKRSGYSPSQASKLGRQIAERPNAPFGWHARRDWKARADGSEGWMSTIEIDPHTERTDDSIRAIATLPALPEKPKHGGSAAAVSARWGRCDRHDKREVWIKGLCPDCGAVVGERMVSRAEFDALKVQDALSETSPPGVVVPVSIVVQDALSDGLVDGLAARRPRAAMDIPPRAPDPSRQPALPHLVGANGHAESTAALQPVHRNRTDGHIPINGHVGEDLPPKPPPWKCRCGSSLRGPRPSDGVEICDGCAEVVG